MKITYDENPLNTKVELDEHESKELWYKIKLEEMEDLLFEAHCFLGRDDGDGITFDQDLDKVAEAADHKYYMAEKHGDRTPLDDRVDKIHKYFIEALVNSHAGDCTCLPCPCEKCWAEHLLDIDTIKGLGKHPAHYLFDAFGETPKNNWKNQRNIHEAIQYLENYVPTANWKGWEQHADRWKSEASEAAKWLKQYRKQHFNES